MRYYLLFALVTLFVVSPAFSQTIPAGQLIDLEVSSGYHLSTSIVLKGSVYIQDNTPARKITLFINDFSTRVTPEGNFAISFPIASLHNDKGTVVTVRAFQDGTNILLEDKFDLAELNSFLTNNITIEELRHIHNKLDFVDRY